MCGFRLAFGCGLVGLFFVGLLLVLIDIVAFLLTRF